MRSKEADEYLNKMSALKTPYFKTVSNINLRIDKDVCATGKLGELFCKAMSLPDIKINIETTVLDYGTGTGFLAIAAAKKGANVIALDKNPAAIECAQYNAKKNNVSEKIEFRLSDNLSALKPQERFDFIVAGLPWDDAVPNTPLEMSFYDPSFRMRIALSEQVNSILKQNGIILLSYSKRVQNKEPIKKFFPNYNCKILLEENIHNEAHYIISITHF